MTVNNHLPIKILNYWHKVEFFVPYDMDEILRRDNARYRLRQLQLEKGNSVLPWCSTTALRLAGGSIDNHYRYNVYQHLQLL